MMKLIVDMPDHASELQVLRRHADGFSPRELADLRPVTTPEELLAAQKAVARVAVSNDVLAYIVDLARATRSAPSVELGASPRASTGLLAAAKAWAWLNGSVAVTPDHVQAMLTSVWRHRISLRPDAQMEGVTADTVLASIVRQTVVPI